MNVALLDDSQTAAYERFVSSQPASTIYASSAYRDFLRSVTHESDRYLVASEDGEIVGVLPAFLQRDRGRGAVMNSLPFFGSLGGVLAANRRREVANALLDAFTRLADEERCISRTIITSPLDPDVSAYEEWPYTFRDERTAQMTPLPAAGSDLDARLLSAFENPRPRNIRKATKSGVTVVERWDEDALRFLARLHVENISALGGLTKPLDVFLAVPRCFSREQYSVFVASRAGRDVAALLVLCYNGIVEYFTPAVLHDERTYQPMSLIVFDAMRTAIGRGFRVWNWGGTWATQVSLYEFKKRWGALDHPYVYFTTVVEGVIQRTREDILSAHPYFFVCPFDRLRQPA